MSKKNSSSTDKKQSATPVIMAVVALLMIVLIGGLYASSLKNKSLETASKTTTAESMTSITSPVQGETAPDSASVPPAESSSAKDNSAPAPVSSASDSAAQVATSATAATAVDSASLESLSKPRILGKKDAPLKILEYSSFTCSHCAQYHSDNFKRIKADYIDTGKAYLVFDDFPRNGVDLYIGMIARCVPEESYFNFIQLLFETQKDWAAEDKYADYAKQNAKLAGTTDEKLSLCIENKELQKAMADSREVASEKFGITGTPTLVINDKIVLSGLMPYDKIKETIDAELAKLVKSGFWHQLKMMME